MGLYAHQDMPRAMFDIGGLNPWNLLLFIIVISWLTNRRRDGSKWDMPTNYKKLLWLYFFIIVLGFIRMIYNLDGLEYYASITGGHMPSKTGLWNEYLLNTIKWVIPSILLFDGCRNDTQVKLALSAILGAHFILALQVIQYIPFYTLISDSGNLTAKTQYILRKDVGYHRTDLAVMLAGYFWAFFSTRDIFQFRAWRLFLHPIGLLILLLSLALTGGRGGYLTWAVIGLFFSLFRYRKLFLILPIVLVIALPYAPGLINRLTQGISSEEGVNHDALTAGRATIWPLVIEEIKNAPIIGHGREAIKRIGLTSKLYLEFHENAPHPHNAYLEALLDNGIIGFTIIVSFYFLIMKNSLALFCDRTNIHYKVVGGVCVSLVGSLLIGSLTGQTFYPRELTTGTWCSIGLLLRMIVNRTIQKN